MVSSSWALNTCGICKMEFWGFDFDPCPVCKDKPKVNFLQVGAQQGWECPRCHTINSPWKHTCDCKPNEFKTTVSDSNNTNIVWEKFTQIQKPMKQPCGCSVELK